MVISLFFFSFSCFVVFFTHVYQQIQIPQEQKCSGEFRRSGIVVDGQSEDVMRAVKWVAQWFQNKDVRETMWRIFVSLKSQCSLNFKIFAMLVFPPFSVAMPKLLAIKKNFQRRNGCKLRLEFHFSLHLYFCFKNILKQLCANGIIFFMMKKKD